MAGKSKAEPYQLVLRRVDLHNPNYATQAPFSCLPKVIYLKYDTVQNALVGIGVNITTLNTTVDTEIYAFVLKDDGSCALSEIPNIALISATTYDPYTSTFYLSSVSYSGVELFMFELKTSKVTTLKIGGILDYMEVEY
eukprot:Phypoly_transcript_05076.p1 GENE.Phypoly_transcript_05076~~Phypoly_transcript_05076.p1  ORF type:complete len:139 (+),score=7.93 Phypoly_transcript_05076:1539-1955(+)